MGWLLPELHLQICGLACLLSTRQSPHSPIPNSHCTHSACPACLFCSQVPAAAPTNAAAGAAGAAAGPSSAGGSSSARGSVGGPASERHLLGVDVRHLKAEDELKRMFGARVVQEEGEERGDAYAGGAVGSSTFSTLFLVFFQVAEAHVLGKGKSEGRVTCACAAEAAKAVIFVLTSLSARAMSTRGQ